ncbi:MAG: AraC family transcriptional regulator [Lachnospiraceae bacterium]|nr:AraC family transcriptional regulator [Lachnospiraceae bacterium]
MNTNKELNYRLYLQRSDNFVRTDIKKEYSRYDYIKNGDVERVKSEFVEIKKDFYKGKGVLSDNPLRNAIYHLVVAVAITARVCVDGGLPHDESYTLSDIYIRKGDTLKDPDEVIDLIGEMQADYAARMRALKKTHSVSIHVIHVIDYIYDHLQEKITMEQLAERENLNPSYFSKLFSKETGMSVKGYINNAKIDTAKQMLTQSDYSITDISLSLGFSSQSAFTACFKQYTGVTPGSYRLHGTYKKILPHSDI